MRFVGNIGIKSSIAFLLLVLLASCSTEQKIVKEAGAYLNKASLLVLFPDQMFITNSKAYSFSDSLSENQKYVASIDSSFFLKEIDTDSIFEEFKLNMVKLYKSYGFKVYLKEDLDSFLTLKTTGLVIEITQLQLEEFYKPFRDEELMENGFTYFSKDFVLNALGLEAWITVSRLNDTLGNYSMIYSEYSISDDMSGLFMKDNGTDKVYYDYNYTPLKVNDSYDIIKESSIKISLDIADFIANAFIEKYMLFNTESYPQRFWRYNPKREKLYPAPIDQKSGYIILQ